MFRGDVVMMWSQFPTMVDTVLQQNMHTVTLTSPFSTSYLWCHPLTYHNNLACHHSHPEMVNVLSPVFNVIHDYSPTIFSFMYPRVSFIITYYMYSSVLFFHCVIASHIITVLTNNTSSHTFHSMSMSVCVVVHVCYSPSITHLPSYPLPLLNVVDIEIGMDQ